MDYREMVDRYCAWVEGWGPKPTYRLDVKPRLSEDDRRATLPEHNERGDS